MAQDVAELRDATPPEAEARREAGPWPRRRKNDDSTSTEVWNVEGPARSRKADKLPRPSAALAFRSGSVSSWRFASRGSCTSFFSATPGQCGPTMRM